MSAALAFRPDGTEAALVFQCKKDAYDTDSLIEFLQELHGQLRNPGENEQRFRANPNTLPVHSEQASG
jgi:hypothetical protein